MVVVDGASAPKKKAKGEPIDSPAAGAGAASANAPHAFALSNLPADVHERIAATLFKQFSDALDEALRLAQGSLQEIEEKTFGESRYKLAQNFNAAALPDHTPEQRDEMYQQARLQEQQEQQAKEAALSTANTSTFAALKDLSRWVAIGRTYRETFRRFYVTAVFRAIVHDAQVEVDEDDLLTGVNFHVTTHKHSVPFLAV